ncbi:MAG: Purine or other phosphorylase family 1 [Candidatus Curtissbacteria bacterium GW2011_GWC2_38_9]|uniref:Uridine phosphorylase n=3 Tax=Candidatus Curtissiibacteriota TaxID=1752717 RepID=A0A1F5HRS1_9BACT|nr:MAG: Purine or other phosphorylase family 1 [Candidatus Curtissbacteria bacterium GW2011_GWC2_38_9]KKS04632.1 MAG: Purine or other phosphorylase family 1 [Candidatus Curtissbacteria bacterium GW2011_GWA2_41_24]OGE06760.1 MAG: hypothetical protein A2W70_04905 [Candidatus Curtissbacteria bacterium RIFCSPLOWO2_02_41_11]
MIQPHLKINKINKFVILPGDPSRIDRVARYVKDFKEISFNREFRIANAKYKKMPISLVSTGIGCPSAAIAVEELSKIGARIVIRLGTCGGLLSEMESGNIVIPTSTICLDGTTREYQPDIKKVNADLQVIKTLEASAKNINIKYFKGLNRTHDAFYESEKNFIKISKIGFISSEMECSAVFLVSKLRGLKAGAILVVKTPEPPELVKKNPEAIYKLTDDKKAEKGVDNAIRIVLESLLKLSH